MLVCFPVDWDKGHNLFREVRQRCVGGWELLLFHAHHDCLEVFRGFIDLVCLYSVRLGNIFGSANRGFEVIPL